MSPAQKDGLLGVSLDGNKIKLVELETLGGQPQINKIAQSPMGFSFTPEILKKREPITELSSTIDQLVKSSGFKAQRAAFSLDSQLVLLKKVPMDSDLSGRELKEQVDWEVQQFLLSPKEEHIVDYYRLLSEWKRGFNEVLIVVVRKSIINYLLEIFKLTPIQLEAVDVDIFAAMRAIQTNYECRSEETIALVEVTYNKLVLSIIKNGEYFLSQDVPYFLNAERTTPFPDSEDLAKLISKELRRIILEHKLGEKIEDLNRIFLYGDMVKDEVLESLQNVHDVRIDRANPFRRLRFASNVSVDETIWAKPETFVACVGAALRGIH